jgi:MoaA/NifB/PqqE/SkfB family radical SAM enzyme
MTAAAPPLPREIQIEVTGACNLACKMCLVRYRPKLGRRSGALCFHTFRRIVDDLPELEQVTLQGLGEPLLAPDLDRMIAYAAKRDIRIGFNTNGTFLTRDRSEALVRAGLAWLHVSVDGASAQTYESIRDGSDFAVVARNVRDLVDVRRELATKLPVLSLVFVAMRRNVDELPELVILAHDWGVDRLFVQNLSHTFSDTDPAGTYSQIRRFAESEALFAEPERAAQAFTRARAVADELGVELRLPRLAEPERRPRAAGEPGCHWPFESAYVTHRGLVQPCCMVMGADRAVLGDASERGFAAVWRDAPYADFRARLADGDPPDVCRGCSLYRGLF